jgi:hypothetical protein
MKKSLDASALKSMVRTGTQKSNDNSSIDDNLIRAVKISIFIPIVFFICWSPGLIKIVFNTFTRQNSKTLDSVSVFCISLISVNDFVVFSMFTEKIKIGIREVFEERGIVVK